MSVPEHRERLAARHPELLVASHDVGGRAWLELATTIGPIECFERYTVLRHNFDLVVGQVVQIDGTYRLRQVLPAAQPPEIVDAVAAELVEGAAKFRAFFEVRR